MPLRAHLLLAFVVSGALLAAQQRPPANAANPLAGNPAAIAAGERLFQQTCVGCHGDHARAPSLATGSFNHGGEDGQIAQTIRGGVAGSQMPPFPGRSSSTA